MTKSIEVDWTNIPAPEDDGEARHLVGSMVPFLPLPSTKGGQVNLAEIPGRCVVYAYPMTRNPDTPLPDGWDMLPGAKGCTPQSCSFRDHALELKKLGVDEVFGVSTQDTAYQREAAERLHLPFALLSDKERSLTHAMRLPTFEISGMILLRRLTMIIRDGKIEHVFYPVFPPDQNVVEVIDWLTVNPC